MAAASKFPSTQWLLVEMAGQSSPDIARAALDHLLKQYWQPLFVHLRYKGMSPEAAEDLIQDFILDILDKNLLAVADRQRGKFRTLLLTALDRFAISKYRYDSAAKRAPKDLSSLDAREGDSPSAGDAGPEAAYDRAWALDVLAETLAAMFDDCQRTGDAARWEVFQERVLGPLLEDSPSPSYQELADRLGLGPEKAAMNLLVTAKRQFSRTLREVVRQYVTQSGPTQTTGAIAVRNASTVPDDPQVSAARQLAEHTVIQAVEREILELQQILASPRARGPLPTDEALRPDDSPVKRRFWRLLTQPNAHLAEQGESIFQVGNRLTEGGLDLWLAELLAADIRHLLGVAYGAEGRVRDFLLATPLNLAVVEHLKEWANVQRFTRLGAPDGDLADAIYFLTIAVALSRADERISGMEDHSVKEGFEELLGKNLLDDEFRPLVVDAMQKLGS